MKPQPRKPQLKLLLRSKPLSLLLNTLQKLPLKNKPPNQLLKPQPRLLPRKKPLSQLLNPLQKPLQKLPQRRKPPRKEEEKARMRNSDLSSKYT